MSADDSRTFGVEVLVSKAHTVRASSMDEAVGEVKELSVPGEVAKIHIQDLEEGGEETLYY